MSLFGTSPPGDAALTAASPRGRNTLFDEDDHTPDDIREPASTKPTSDSLFADDHNADGNATPAADANGAASPWDMPTPRKQRSRTDVVRNLLPATNVPDSYVDAFDAVVREDGVGGRIGSSGITRTLAAAKLAADHQARIMSIVAPSRGTDRASTFGRGEFNVLLALIALAQQGEPISLDSVDERRRHLPEPALGSLSSNAASHSFSVPARAELAAKPPQRPITPPASHKSPPMKTTSNNHNPSSSSMDFHSDPDPWNAPDLHRGHNHAAEPTGTSSASTAATTTSPSSAIAAAQKPNGIAPSIAPAPPASTPIPETNGDSRNTYAQERLMTPSMPANVRTTSDFTTTSDYTSATTGAGGPARQTGGNSLGSAGGWGGGSGGYYEGNALFGDGAVNPNPFGGPNNGGGSGGGGGGGGGGDRDRDPGNNPPGPSSTRTLGSGRTGAGVEENILVALMPEKEGMFFFQHHNYEVSSIRRGSKVIRRYSDFVWLLDCLQKRYPFRALPLLPPKRVAVNGNHLSNDGAFIEKRRRGLARFLNGVVRHPILAQEQLVIMFLTVPTELAVWRKQATISVQDEFTGRELAPGLEASLPPTLEDLFSRTRMGVRRSAELYIGVCNIMDRLVKRSEGVAADHARIALSLMSLTELSNDTYSTDTNDVPLLNDGLVSMAKHLRTTQGLMEDECKAWDQGVLEDLKRQRDSLVGIRDLFDRRERYDRDNIPQLERRIGKNEAKLAELRSRPEGMVKPGEAEKVEQAIVADKHSIIDQHNRSVFVKECIRDELVLFQTTQYHVSSWNQDWAQERVKYAELLADNWRGLLDELEGMPLGN